MGHAIDGLHFGLSNLQNKNTAYTDTALVNVQHDLSCLFHRFSKHHHENVYDEFHGGIIIVVQQDPEHGRLFNLIFSPNLHNLFCVCSAFAHIYNILPLIRFIAAIRCNRFIISIRIWPCKEIMAHHDKVTISGSRPAAVKRIRPMLKGAPRRDWLAEPGLKQSTPVSQRIIG